MQQLFEQKLVNTIKDILREKEETIAVAESVTAGLLQLALASATDAGHYFHGGITAYNLGQKYRHLLIDPIYAQSCNCVSERVASDMALNVCQLFRSDWGIGITGYSTPVPESGNKLFAYYALSCKGRVVIADKVTVKVDDPLSAQVFYVNHLLQHFLHYLQHTEGKDKKLKKTPH